MSRQSRRSFTRGVVLVAALPGLLFAQRGGGRGRAGDTVASDVAWRNVGPDAAGRMVAVAGSVARPNEYYFGTTGGGVWKTIDGAKTWQYMGLKETQQ
ncbi:MAG: hypothetical protein ABI442_19885, partial [Gemmatimonadaceae bacterium]